MSQSLLRSASLVSAMTLLSRILGLVRDVLFATLGGAGSAMDAFFIAFKIPNFMRRLFAEGAFTQAFVPVFAEYKQRGEEDELKRVVGQVAGTLGGVLLIFTLLIEFAAPVVVYVFAPGFADDPAKFQLTTELIRITFPYLICISLVALAGGVLNSYGLFAAAAFAPVLLNLSLISFATLFVDQFDVPQRALAWGVFVAGIAQLIFLWWRLAKLGFLSKPSWAWSAEPVRKILRLMAPAALGSSIAQLSLLLDTLIASFLFAGSVSWLYYSDRLMEFPLGVLAIAISTVILPKLSGQHAAADPQAFRRTLDWGLRTVVVLIVPAMIGLLVLAGPMVAALFQYGQFTTDDAMASRASLMAYSVGLLGFTLIKVLIPGFFARQDTRTPVRIGLWAIAANMGLNVVLVLPMYLLDWKYAHVGLAAATSIGAFVNAGLLAMTLRREGVLVFQPGWPKLLLQVACGSAVLALLLLSLQGDMVQWFAWSMWQRVGMLTAIVLAGAAVYLLAIVVTGFRFRDLQPT